MGDFQTLSRRDFFRVMGLSAVAAAAGCSRVQQEEIVPHVQAQEIGAPGVPLWYASTCAACPARCGVLLKTRDGRPIKVEGNELHPHTRGGLCAMGQASVLSLYDASRSKGPTSGGTPTTWKPLDEVVAAGLAKLAGEGRAIRLVAPLDCGPSNEAAIEAFLAKFPTAKRVRHDPLGLHAVAEAHLLTHGARVLPGYDLEAARVVVGFAADFLGTWPHPVALTKQYAARKDPTKGIRHFQLEPFMTVTGSNADVRRSIAPSDIVPALGFVARALGVDVPGLSKTRTGTAILDRISRELDAARGESLLLCGSSDVHAQVLANAINQVLGNYGKTVHAADGLALRESLSVDDLLGELSAGQVGAVVLLGVNPVYDHSRGDELAELLGEVELTVATNDRPDETGRHVKYLAPAHHFLESWGDAEVRRGVVSLSQPAVAPLYDTRDAFDSLLVWAGAAKEARERVRAYWQENVAKRVEPAPANFEVFWRKSLSDGFATYKAEAIEVAWRGDGPGEAPRSGAEPGAEPGAGMEVALYSSVALREGGLANNGWLQELPDPITKATWGNVARLAPEAAKRLGISDGDLVRIESNGRRVVLPALSDPGTHPEVIAVAVGYGRSAAGSIGDGVGENAFPLVGGAATIERAGGSVVIPLTQTYHSQEGREIAREIDLEEARKAAPPEKADAHGSMWASKAYPGHRWGMAIDLTRCTGCSACVVGCQAENNIAIVGADEVRRNRDMHWMRIDRYCGGSGDEPRVVHQPLLCQHCENAPCETVCPVLATVHSSEGLNQQVYNRCVGTRYCANNCPYKVRRFNWLDHPRNASERMVLNPDVVERSRGVMEKCSFCVQRINAAKTQARKEGRALRDGDARPACEQSCPAGAIVFGDLNDPESRVSRLSRDGRAYRVLENLNVKPVVRYLSRVRNAGGRA